MNFLKKLFFTSRKKGPNSPQKESSPPDKETFYTPLEKIIPVFFEGKIEKRPFFNELVNIPLYMLTVNEENTQPLVISKENSSPVVVFATSKERSEQISTAFSDVTSSAQVSLAHYMSTIAEPVSIVINPGWKFEITIDKKSVGELMKSISMEFCNLDIMTSRYISNQITMDELCQAVKQYNFGITLIEEDTENLEEHMALIIRGGETYSAVFSSEAFAQEYREIYPEFAYSANAKGEELLKMLPDNAGIIINPESDFEVLINRVTLFQKKRGL